MDDFACSPVFHGRGLVSNSLLLIDRVLRATGTFAVNRSSMASYFFQENGFSAQLSTFETLIQGIRLAPAGTSVSVKRKIKLTAQKVDTSMVSHDEYWALLERGAAEIAENVQAAIDSFPDAIAALTGGRDSRIVYGAILAAGRQDDVRFTTLDIGRDLEIAQGLLGHFGGRFSRDVAVIDEGFRTVRLTSLDDSLDTQISHCYFSNHNIHRIDYPARYEAGCPFTLLGGGSGEVYRSFYGTAVRKVLACSQGETADDLAMLKKWIASAAENSKADTDLLKPALEDTFTHLAGHGVSQAFASHYLNFRNKYHFGNKLQRAFKTDFMPLQSRTLLNLSRRVPAEILDHGHILSDLTEQFSADLARFEYDKPNAPDRPKHPFARRSATPRDEIACNSASYLGSPVQKPVEDQTMPSYSTPYKMHKHILDHGTSLVASLEQRDLLGLPPEYLQGKMTWLFNKKSPGLAKWYSYVRMLDHFRDS